MLEGRLVQMPFGDGLSQEIAEALVPQGKLQVATNAWVAKRGSIQQRPGTDKLNGRVMGVPQWGRSRQCYTFVGTNWIEWAAGATTPLNFTANSIVHMSFWVYSTNLAGTRGLVRRFSGLNNTGWFVNKEAGNIIVCRRWDNGFGTIHEHRVSFVCDITEWTNIQVVFVDHETVRLYRNGHAINGTVEANTLTPATNIQQNAEGLLIGAYNLVGPYLTGAMDDLCFFENNIPTEADVVDLYNGGLPGAVYTYPDRIRGRFLFEGDLGDRSYLNGVGAAGGVGGGFGQFTPTGHVHKALHVFPDERETVVVTDRHVLTRLHEEDAWRRVDHCYEANIERVIRGERSAESMRQGPTTFPPPVDSCIIDKWMFYAWVVLDDVSSRTIYMRFLDMETGAKTEYASENFQGATTISANKIRCIAAWPYVYAVFSHIDSGEIRAYRWDIRDIEAGYIEIMLGDGVVDPWAWDIVAKPMSALSPSAGEPLIVLVYSWAYFDGDVMVEATRIHKGYANAWPTASDYQPYRAPDFKVRAEYGVDVCNTTEDAYVAYDVEGRTGRAIDGFVVDETLNTHAPATELRPIIDQPGAAYSYRLGVVVEDRGNRAWVAWEQFNGSFWPPTPRSLNGLWFDRDARADDGHKTYHMGLLSRPWIKDGVVYAHVFVDETIKETYVIQEPN